jgi:tetratricopeptide (TPR) repeat protein/transcriptional regulator with XRE-family HTH domain
LSADAPEISSAAARVSTLEDLAALLRDLRRRHARSRRDRSLTYRELAAKTGWSQTAIAEYFTARTLPPTDRFDALIDVLDASPADRRALADARDRVEETHRRVRDRRGAGTASQSPARASGGAARVVPRQLPAAPRLFTGRTAELARLDAALGPRDALAISAISGSGGIGKTWLALHWAHRRLDRFPDGQLYVNLRGFDPSGQPLAPAAVLRGFLQALGAEPGAIPSEPEAQVGLYRSLLAGRRMLILLDNARDTAQLASLLPGDSTCTVLITSRRDLTGLIATHGAHPVNLDVLPRHEARELLARHLGRARLESEPEATGRLLDCCGGMPLALGIVTARAAAHSRLALSELAGELHDQAHRLDALDAGEPQADLRAVLSWSTRVLEPDAAAAFGLLGIAPGPDISLAAAASLLGRSAADARTLLCELEYAHLIQRHGADRYRMHDLLRLHAAEQAPVERRPALRRLIDHYVHALSDPPPAAPWFDAEHACLLAAQQLAHSYGWDAEVCRLASTLDPYHRRRGHPDEQVASWQRAVASARRLKDPALQMSAHQLLGDAYAQVGRTSEALSQLHSALVLAEGRGDVAGQAAIRHSLGGAWERHGDDRRALENASRALGFFLELGDGFQRARALNAVGWLQARLGRYAEARANCEAALTLLRRQGADVRQSSEPHALDSLGYIAYHLREYDQALDYYRQALALCRARGDSFLEADLHDHIAATRLAQRRPDQARRAWTEALALYDAQHRLAAAESVSRHLAELERPAPSRSQQTIDTPG